MSYLNKIARALEFIEENLREKINLPDVAKAATMSLYHFHRIFQFSTGEIVGEYIRKRRLSCAAADLLNTQRKVIEIAFDYSFDSVEAFSRSFKKQMLYSPMQYRKNNFYDRRLIKEPIKPDVLKHLVDGGISLTPRFVDLDPFTIVGFYGEDVKARIAEKFGWAKKELAERRQEIDDVCSPLSYYAYPPVWGIDIWNQRLNTTMKIMVGLKVSQTERIPAGMTAYRVEGGKYAVFQHSPMTQISSTFAYIFNIWFSVNDEYELDERTDFILFDDRLKMDSPDQLIEIYMPVKAARPD